MLALKDEGEGANSESLLESLKDVKGSSVLEKCEVVFEEEFEGVEHHEKCEVFECVEVALL